MPDELTPTERLLLTALTRVSQDIDEFVRQALAADAGHGQFASTDEEWQLGARMTQLGAVLQVRATERRVCRE